MYKQWKLRFEQLQMIQNNWYYHSYTDQYETIKWFQYYQQCLFILECNGFIYSLFFVHFVPYFGLHWCHCAIDIIQHAMYCNLILRYQYSHQTLLYNRHCLEHKASGSEESVHKCDAKLFFSRADRPTIIIDIWMMFCFDYDLYEGERKPRLWYNIGVKSIVFICMPI